jgi:hypothetical protein
MPKNLKEASKASKLSKLDTLGKSKLEFDEGDKLDAIEIAAGKFIKRVQTNIEESNMIVSGKISDITIQRKNDVIEVLGSPELVYQDKGVNGAIIKKYDTPFSFKNSRPPVQPFIEWIKRKNINLRNNEKYGGKGSEFKKLSKEEQIESAAYAIRESVYQKGFKPRKIYSKEIPKLIEDVKNEVSNYMVETILKGFKNDN